MTLVSTVQSTPKCCTCKVIVNKLSNRLNKFNCDNIGKLIKVVCRSSKVCVNYFNQICEGVVKQLKDKVDANKICGIGQLNYCATNDPPTLPTPTDTNSPSTQYTSESHGPAFSVYPPLNRSSEASFDFMNATNTTSLQFGSCGKCGLLYKTCCIASKVAGHPCQCKLKVTGDADHCGDCGCGWEWCCHSTQTNPAGTCKCPIGIP